MTKYKIKKRYSHGIRVLGKRTDLKSGGELKGVALNLAN
jgi:hypothetical protein